MSTQRFTESTKRRYRRILKLIDEGESHIIACKKTGLSYARFLVLLKLYDRDIYERII